MDENDTKPNPEEKSRREPASHLSLEEIPSQPNFIRRSVRRNANIYHFENDMRMQGLSEMLGQSQIEQESQLNDLLPSIEDFSSVRTASLLDLDLKDSACSICHGTLVTNDETKFSQLSCRHSFHESCIVEWLQRKANCPICREKVE